MAPHPTLYVRRALLQSSGGFNLDYRLQSDFDLELRLFECMKMRAKYLPRRLVRMRMGGATTGSMRNILRGNFEAAKSAQCNGFPGGLALGNPRDSMDTGFPAPLSAWTLFAHGLVEARAGFSRPNQEWAHGDGKQRGLEACLQTLLSRR
jgi:hypothetical protein